MIDDERTWAVKRILFDYVKSPSLRHILAIDTAVALRCAGLHVPDRRPERDALIAATAAVHGLTVVTRNIADFQPIGIPVLMALTMAYYPNCVD